MKLVGQGLQKVQHSPALIVIILTAVWKPKCSLCCSQNVSEFYMPSSSTNNLLQNSLFSPYTSAMACSSNLHLAATTNKCSQLFTALIALLMVACSPAVMTTNSQRSSDMPLYNSRSSTVMSRSSRKLSFLSESTVYARYAGTSYSIITGSDSTAKNKGTPLLKRQE